MGRSAYAAGKTQAPVREVIRAERFELVDSQGRKRAVLVLTREGLLLALYDEAKKVRATLGAVPEGPALVLALSAGDNSHTARIGPKPTKTLALRQ